MTFIRCQSTLGELVERDGGLFSPAADLLYPVRNGLVFMGYPVRDREFVARVIEVESAHQTSAAHIDRDLQFLRSNAPMLIDLLNYLIDRDLLAPGSRGLEIGAASGWPAWLLAEAGCEMWLCELEPNSLASGLIFAHPRIGPESRVVCDGRYLPFADGELDVVLSKEFAHHVEDKAGLFREVNRVLKPGGLLLVIDPVRDVKGMRQRDDHFGHSITWSGAYRSALREAGFDAGTYTNYHWYTGGRFRITRWARSRTRENLRGGVMKSDVLTRSVMTLMGGSLIVVARKLHGVPPEPRPRLELVDPSLLTWPSSGYDRTPFLEELQTMAGQLHRQSSLR